MEPVEFPQQTVVYAKDQPQYLPLPSHRDRDGIVTTCWSLTWRELLHLLFTRRVWVQQMTFCQPLQPQRLQVERPFETPKPQSNPGASTAMV